MTRALVAQVETTSLAFPAAAVRAVLAAPRLTPVPTAPPTVLGLANVRGDVVPVFDTGLLLAADAVGAAPFVLVVDTSYGPAGLAVPSMPDTRDLDDEDDAFTDPDRLVPR